MRKKPYYVTVILLTISIFLSFGSPLFAQRPLPKQIKQEEVAFFESQISDTNKIFFNKLSTNFKYLSRINSQAVKVLNRLSSIVELEHSEFIKGIRKEAAKAIRTLTKRKKSGRNLKCFIETYLGKNNNLRSEFRNLLTNYQEIKKLKSSFEDPFLENLPTDGIYRYYILCSDSLRYSPQEILAQIISTNEELSNFAKNYRIEKLKKLLVEKISFLEKFSALMQGELIDCLKYAQSDWGRNLTLKVLELTQHQLLLDRDFFESVLTKLESVPTPRKPDPPDLKVISIEISAADTIKVGDKISVIVAIKNIGQLTVRASKAKITFPDGKTRVIAVPRLKGGQTHITTLRFRLEHAGRNEFIVTVNSNFRAWESDTTNNITKRALILQ